MCTPKNEIHLSFSRDEALVLFEFLAHLDETESRTAIDDATQKVLWRLEGYLEETLPEIVSLDYTKLVVAAKERLTGKTC